MGFIKRWLIKRALKKKTTQSDIEAVADEVLKDALKELQNTGRTADKILKAKLIRQESRHALSKIRELDEEEDDEEEEEPRDSIEDTITNALIQKFIGGGAASNPQNNSANLQQLASQLTPEQLEALKKKFL